MPVVTKHEKLILFIDLDAEFHVLKLLFEVFLPKIIREAGNCESLILRVKSLCLKYGGIHCIDTLCKKINKAYFLIKVLKSYLHENQILKIYFATVYSYLNYKILL